MLDSSSLPLVVDSSVNFINNSQEQIVGVVRESHHQELVFIDAAITDAAILTSKFHNAHVIQLNAELDGIDRITNVLGQYQDIASIHIISHGSPGDIQLGNSHLNLANLPNYSQKLQQWRAALTTDADVLFYGCNIGAGVEGGTLVSEIGQITGADIAASNNLTGNAALGGDWNLEVHSGKIETPTEIVADYQGILPIYNGKEYLLTNSAKSWTDAQAEATSLGGNLVTINNAAEENWLKQTFGTSEQLWIGLTDRTTEGTFKWVNGETATYRNWNPGEPNNATFGGAVPEGEDYAVINQGTQWNDIPNTYAGNVRGIIERNTDADFTYDGKKYRLTTSAKSWTDAQAEATSLGGNLVTINNAAEENWLKQTFGTSEQLWIGLTDRTTEGTFKWVNGETATYRNWNPGEPNNATFGGAVPEGEDYAVINQGTQWNDIPNTYAGNVRGIIEIGNDFTYDGKKYQLTTGAKSWTNAQAEATSLGGNLVTINNAAEENWLKQTFGTSEQLWIGLTDRTTEGKFEWVNGETATYRNWNPGEPNNATFGGAVPEGEDYAVINQGTQWNDIPNTYAGNVRGIIEIGANSPNAGLIGLETSTYQIAETNNQVNVAILRQGGSNGTVTVDYRTVDASAKAGSDYQTVSGRVTFAPGETRKSIAIPILNDNLAEGDEQFNLTIDNVLGGATLSAPRTATITIIDDEAPTPLVAFNDFTSITGLTLNGQATKSGNRLRLTEDLSSQASTAFLNRPLAIAANTSFSNKFEFQIGGTAGTNGGDGFTFMLQNTLGAANALGNLGGNLGYSGISKSLAIEFDTFQNEWDSGNNQISVLRDGVVDQSVITANAPLDLNSGNRLTAWIDYDGATNNLAVFLAQTATKPNTAVLTYNTDLPTVVGSQAFLGFSAGTGGATNTHDLLNWSLSSNSDLLPAPNPTPVAQKQTTVANLSQPIAIDWAPDGSKMFIAEKGGVIKVFENGQLRATPFIDLSNIVNSASDRGLLDIAVHPDFFAGKPYIYASYTYDPAQVAQNSGLAGADGDGNRANRLTRITADPATNYTTAIAGSEVVILGKNSTWNNFNAFVNSTVDFNEKPAGILADGTNLRDFIAQDSQSHVGGSLQFAADGALFVSIGDGISYNQLDPRGVRVQDIDNLSGKVLRIDPLTGAGLADNPFYNGDRDANRSKVYQSGLRNPFRTAIDARNGQLYIGDVGWTQWEEINAGGAGANFGWPYYEGGNGVNLRTSAYQDLPAAQAFYASGKQATPALLALNHAADGINAIILGDVYTGTKLPEKYRDNLFFNDLGQGIVRNAKLDAAGNIASVEVFATDAQYVVQITQGPDGELYYVDLDDGVVGRWQVG